MFRMLSFYEMKRQLSRKLWSSSVHMSTERSYKKLQLQGKYKQELKNAKKEGTVFNRVTLIDVMEQVA